MFDIIKVGGIAGLGESIQVDDTPVRADGKGIPDEIGADKSGTACDQKSF